MDYKMDYQTFQQVLQELVEEGLKEKGDYSCSRYMAHKNNISKPGLLISERGKTLSVTVYFDQFYPEYLKGTSLSQLSSQIVEFNLEHELPEISKEDMSDYGKIKEKLRIRLVGREQNSAYLEEGPYKIHPMGAEVVYVELFRRSDGMFVSRVTHPMLERWGVSEKEIFDVALENSQNKEGLRFCSLTSEIARIGGLESLGEETIKKNELYIASNQEREHGAAVLLYPGALEEIHDRMGGDFYILPSSVHEVMVLSKDSDFSPDTLKSMVKEINQTQVAPEERLGNEVYEFLGETGTLQKCKTAEKERSR